jgi:hypothetical protein
MSRVAAAKVLLDRGWGKCSETHHIDVIASTVRYTTMSPHRFRGFWKD